MYEIGLIRKLKSTKQYCIVYYKSIPYYFNKWWWVKINSAFRVFFEDLSYWDTAIISYVQLNFKKKCYKVHHIKILNSNYFALSKKKKSKVIIFAQYLIICFL